MNPQLSRLHPYPFEKLRQLHKEISPPKDKRPIALSLGEPQHTTPGFIGEELAAHLAALTQYPSTKGSPTLRDTIRNWLIQRFDLPVTSLNAEQHILPLSGTREGLYSIAQCVVDRSQNALVAMPNPFYQIYEGAALLASAEPYYLNAESATGFLPDFESVPKSIWSRCQLLYICTPGNPTGATMSLYALQQLIELAIRHDFIIASDECYSEIYSDESKPPTGLLQAAAAMGNDTYQNCVVFHSLSKRSNAPGLRSGFVAGNASILKNYALYRTYHGCAMPVYCQMASIKAWSNESHVRQNRDLYRQKFRAVAEVLDDVWALEIPPASFYLWPETPICDTEFAQRLYQQENVMVLPGSFLSRPVNQVDPGKNRIRIALVPSLDDCVEAAFRIKNVICSL